MKEMVSVTTPAAGTFGTKEKTLYILLLLFFFALYAPLVSWLYNVCMWVIFVYSFFFNTVAEKWTLVKNRRAVVFMILFFLVNVISGLLSVNSKEGISWMGIRISLLVFPLSVGSIYISRFLKEKILLGFVMATCTAATGCLLYGIVRAAMQRDWSLLYNDNLSEIINLQSIYFAMLINIAFLSFGFLKTNKSVVAAKYPWWLIVLILLPVHFLLASRIAIIILYGFMLCGAVYIIIFRKKILQGLGLAGGLLLAGCLLFLFFPKTLNRFKEIGYTQFNYNSTAKESHFNATLTPDQWNGANIRIAVWECVQTIIGKHFWLGTGLGDKMEVLKKQYAAKGFVFGIQTNRNVHNTYLDVWMSLGLVGLVIFMMACFVLPVAACFRTQDWYGLLVIGCLFIALFTETYLDRTIGNTILAFFSAFLASYKKPGNLQNAY